MAQQQSQSQSQSLKEQNQERESTGQNNMQNQNQTQSHNNISQGQNNSSGALSKDAQVVAAILKEMSIQSYEPRVVHQLLEFTNAYVSTILKDAQTFSEYAKKSTIDVDDIQLAVSMQVDKSMTTPPPKDLLMEIAREKNNQPLPQIKSQNGPRLPFDRYCLTGTNFRLKSNKSN